MSSLLPGPAAALGKCSHVESRSEREVDRATGCFLRLSLGTEDQNPMKPSIDEVASSKRNCKVVRQKGRRHEVLETVR